MLGMLEVLQPMLAEVAQIDTIRQRLAHQRPGRDEIRTCPPWPTPAMRLAR